MLRILLVTITDILRRNLCAKNIYFTTYKIATAITKLPKDIIVTVELPREKFEPPLVTSLNLFFTPPPLWRGFWNRLLLPLISAFSEGYLELTK